ncbi:TetR/AcrR family transcriptional regulator [Nonomuraea typhae]|uniref:TetR/AcrR family transcriptional regulator n=1 Tax=Nonomuraea typhae TaxID=2603600 RepID=UPI0012F734E3|nr:TetR/AcrR family transcriptional regulator [Nonomuraea typhae]
MPKQVDYETRRRHIAEAVCDLIERHGPEGATLREVAEQAGVSMGAVQRCFATKEEMLVFALRHVTERITEHGKADIAASGTGQSAATLLTATLRSITLVEAHQRRDAAILAAFTAHAAATPSLAAVLRQAHAQTRALLVWLIRYGQQTREFRTGLDAEQAADTLLPLAEGLTALALVGHHGATPAHATLRRHVNALLGDG